MTWSPLGRLWASTALVSAWLMLLLTGFAGGGLVHALLGLALLAFPWRDVG